MLQHEDDLTLYGLCSGGQGTLELFFENHLSPEIKRRIYNRAYVIWYDYKSPKELSWGETLINLMVTFTGSRKHCELVFYSEKSNYWITFGVTARRGVVEFRKNKEYDPKWAYKALHVTSENIHAMMLWCTTQLGKPFDTSYLGYGISSWFAYRNYVSSLVEENPTSLESYVCTTFVSMALRQVFTSFEELFDIHSPPVKYSYRIWVLTPTQLKLLMEEIQAKGYERIITDALIFPRHKNVRLRISEQIE